MQNRMVRDEFHNRRTDAPHFLVLLVALLWRADRTQKLKDARSEASKEIEQLKSKKEKEFNDFQKEVSRRSAFCSTLHNEHR